MKTLLTFFLLLNFGFANASDSKSVPSLLRSAFCSNTGTHTTQALSQSQSMKDIITALEANSDCIHLASSTKTLINSLEQLDQLDRNGTIVEKLEHSVAFYEESIAIEKANMTASYIANYKLNNPNATNTEIQNEIKNFEPDSDLLIQMNSRLDLARLDLFSSQLELNSFLRNNSETKKKELISIVSKNMNSVFDSLNTSNACTNTNESITPVVIANVLSAVGSATYGVSGSAISLSANLISGATQLIRESKYNTNIKKIEFNELKATLGCTMEGITKTYCQAKDTQALVNYHNNDSGQNCTTDECRLIKDGLNLVTKKSNAMNSWANLILSGGSPRDETQVGSYEGAITLRGQFNVVSQKLKGHLNGARNDINLSGVSAEDKELITRELMLSLAELAQNNTDSGSSSGISSSSSTASIPVFSRFFQTDKKCGAYAYFFNPTRNTRRLIRSQDFEACETAVNRDFQNIISLSELEYRIDLLISETSRFVSFEVQKVSEENKSSILVKFNSRDNLYNSSPRDFANLTLSYYSELRKYLKSKNVQNILLENLMVRAENQLKGMLDEVDKNKCNNDSVFKLINGDCDIEAEKLSILSQIVSPNQQVLSISSSLETIFREHIEIVKENGEIGGDELMLILDSSSENSSTVLSNTLLGRHELDIDSSNAMSLTKTNLDNFWSIFKPSILGTLKKMKTKHMSRNDKKVLGRLCVQLALAPISSRSSKKTLKRICKGTYYEILSDTGLETISFDSIIDQSFESKACSLFDLKRKINLLNRT